MLGNATLLQGDESEGRLLLLQIDCDMITDDDWYQDYRAYFYIHAADLGAHRLEQVHCTLQR